MKKLLILTSLLLFYQSCSLPLYTFNFFTPKSTSIDKLKTSPDFFVYENEKYDLTLNIFFNCNNENNLFRPMFFLDNLYLEGGFSCWKNSPTDTYSSNTSYYAISSFPEEYEIKNVFIISKMKLLVANSKNIIIPYEYTTDKNNLFAVVEIFDQKTKKNFYVRSSNTTYSKIYPSKEGERQVTFSQI